MDVDNEVDQILLQQFSCMGTTDKDELVKQLQMLVGNNLNEAAAAFFLDMNNWYVIKTKLFIVLHYCFLLCWLLQPI